MSAYTQAPDLSQPSARRRRLDTQRALDCLVAALALVWIAPLMVLIALAVRIESRGPIFFSQTRLGRDGVHFRLRKFRKFHEQGNKKSLAVTLRNDPRMTRVGRVLERTKLDELPQLWNVLVGDMALVGPRPESLAFADCFNEAFRHVLDYRPGIFGPCQVIFRNENMYYTAGCDPEVFYRKILFPLKAHVDLTYFPRRSLGGDMVWAGRSVLAVFGWSFLPDDTMRGLKGVEHWVQAFGQTIG